MPKVVYVLAAGSEQVLDVPVGTSVMQAAVSAGVPGIIAECGGSAMCATCHVYAEGDSLPPVSENEAEMLDCTASPRKPDSRLSCQLVMTEAMDKLRVRIPPAQV